jgi:Tfp pilus assembly protein PilV
MVGFAMIGALVVLILLTIGIYQSLKFLMKKNKDTDNESR